MRAAFLSVLIITFFINILLVGFSMTRKERKKSIYFTILCIAAGLYIFGYILEVLSPTVEAAVIANRLQNLGIPMIGPVTLLCVLAICNYRLLRPWMGLIALGYSFAMSFFILFNDMHMLYYTSVDRLPIGNMYYLLLGHGPVYYVQQGVSATCIAAAYAALIGRIMVWTSKARRQAIMITMGLTVAFLINCLYFLRLIPPFIDPTPFGLTLSLIFVMISILRYKLFDIVPVASETAVEASDAAIVVLDTDWCFQSANSAAEKLFPLMGRLYGTEPIEVIPHWPKCLDHYPGPEEVSFQLEVDGERRSFRARVCEVREGKSPLGWSILIQDVTHTIHLMKQLQTMATTDFLTGIYNRRHFMEAAERELALARREGLPTSLALFDLDHFKDINDTFGHQAGDQVLTELATAVKRELRRYDVFARYGGEEFVIFSVGMGIEDAQRFAQRLCETAERICLNFGGAEIKITASFGVVELTPDCSLEDATAAADRAMYRAKQNGRNRVEIGRIRYKRVGKSL